MNTAGQALEHPQTRAVGLVVDVPGGLPGCTRSLGPAVALDGRYGDTPAVTPPPRVGQHSRDILAAFGFTADEVHELIAAGVVGDDCAAPPG